MGKYVESHLNKNEVIVQKAKLNGLMLFWKWVWGIVGAVFLLIPTFKAIAATIRFNKTELAVTNKRIVGKIGVFNTKSLDAPLNKIQNTSAESKFFGKIFNYGTVIINTAAGEYKFFGVKNVEAFKGMVMNQIEEYEEQRMRDQANQMATAMASAINNR